MDFEYDDEQQALRDAVRGLVGKTYADHEHRRTTTKEAPGFDEKLWARMAEMGLLGLPFAEDDGGVGAGPVEIGIVCQELGRVAAPEPYLAAVVMAGGLVAACGTPCAARRGGHPAGGRRAHPRAGPHRARWPLERLGERRHRVGGRRQLDPHRHQGTGAARRPRRRARRERSAARRCRDRPVPGRPCDGDRDRLRRLRRQPRRPRRPRRDPGHSAGRVRPRPHRQHRDRARPRPGDGGQPVAGRDADGAVGDDRLPHEPQAVRRHA